MLITNDMPKCWLCLKCQIQIFYHEHINIILSTLIVHCVLEPEDKGRLKMASKQIRTRIDWKEMMAKFKDQTYTFPNAKVNWFPGHMVKGLRQMQHSLHKTDCVLEVHDARIPLSGRNDSFKNNITGNRPQILVLNKQDLAFGQTKSKQKNS